MANLKDDNYHIGKIIENIDFILEHCNGLSLEQLSCNEVLLDSIMFRFIQIAENAQALSGTFLDKTKHLPWHQLNGIRNRIVHAYDIVRVDIVYDTINNDLKPFKSALAALLAESGQ